MKKGNLFGNLLKQLFFSLLISYFIFLGNSSVNAYFDETIIINLPGHFYYGTGGANFIYSNLNFTWESNSYLHINDNSDGENNSYYIFWNNGKIYVYSYYSWSNSYNQGYYTKFCKVNGTGYSLSNCSKSIGDEFYSLTGVNFTQFIGSWQGETDDPGLCFYNSNNNTNYCTSILDESGNPLLSGSLNIINGHTDFSNYAQKSIFNSSGGNFNNIDNTTIINNTYNCPTIQQLINTYPSNYNTGLCYSNNTIISGMQLTQVTPKTIFELFPTWSDYNNAIQLYYNYCETTNTTENCNIAFKGTTGTQQYQIIAKNIRSKTDTTQKGIYTYCNYQLNIPDKNATTCTLNTGTTQVVPIDQITNEDIINDIINGRYNTITPKNESVFEQIKKNGAGTGNTEGWDINRNIIESIDNIYTKITGLFKGRTGKNGIIPEYITRIILLFIFIAMFK